MKGGKNYLFDRRKEREKKKKREEKSISRYSIHINESRGKYL